MGNKRTHDRWGVPYENFKGAQRYQVTPHEFEVAGHKYKARHLTPLEQVHIARRLAPVLLGALKPEEGRKAIIARLASMTTLAASQDEGAAETASQEQIIADALDLATSIFSAAAAADEESINAIIRKCMDKIMRQFESGGAMGIWDTKEDLPRYDDIDGFTMLAIVVRYLFAEFQESIVEYLTSLNLKPGPALTGAAGNRPRPPGAPSSGEE